MCIYIYIDVSVYIYLGVFLFYCIHRSCCTKRCLNPEWQIIMIFIYNAWYQTSPCWLAPEWAWRTSAADSIPCAWRVPQLPPNQSARWLPCPQEHSPPCCIGPHGSQVVANSPHMPLHIIQPVPLVTHERVCLRLLQLIPEKSTIQPSQIALPMKINHDKMNASRKTIIQKLSPVVWCSVVLQGSSFPATPVGPRHMSIVSCKIALVSLEKSLETCTLCYLSTFGFSYWLLSVNVNQSSLPSAQANDVLEVASLQCLLHWKLRELVPCVLDHHELFLATIALWKVPVFPAPLSWDKL